MLSAHESHPIVLYLALFLMRTLLFPIFVSYIIMVFFFYLSLVFSNWFWCALVLYLFCLESVCFLVSWICRFMYLSIRTIFSLYFLLWFQLHVCWTAWCYPTTHWGSLHFLNFFSLASVQIISIALFSDSLFFCSI